MGTILKSSGISFIAFDASPSRVAEFRSQGHPVYYGDIGDADLLGAARIEQVDLVVLTIDDRPAALRATKLIRGLAPRTLIVARAHDLSTSSALLQGAPTRPFPRPWRRASSSRQKLSRAWASPPGTQTCSCVACAEQTTPWCRRRAQISTLHP